MLITKDSDFVQLLERFGPPPRLVWLTTGNSSTPFLQVVLQRRFPNVLAALGAGEAIIEITR